MTADVRARTDEQLATLVRARADLAWPPPGDLSSLVNRAATPASTQRALAGLDRGRLRVLQALAGAGDPVDLDGVARVLDVAPVELGPFVDHLWSLALLWRGADGWHVPRSVQVALGQWLGRSLDPDAGLAPPPLGAAGPDAGADAGPDAGPDSEADPAGVDLAAGARAGELLGLVDELCVRWGDDPPRVLRSGGLAVRDLKGVQAALDTSAGQAAFVVELAYAAGLVAEDGELDPAWAPTPGYDAWADSAPPQRWALLATAWLAAGRAACLVGRPGEAGGVNALSREVQWPLARQLRLDTLRELSGLAPGRTADVDALVARVRWRRALRPPDTVELLVRATAAEAEWLGVTGRGGLATAGRALLEPDAAAASVAAAVQPALPSPVEHVLLQADLTAVAPGRVEGHLARLLRLLSDVESRGGASVHRFSPASIRRGLDAGWSAADILAALRQASRTALPQPLEYLVGDVARTHGSTRVGAATAYLRSDDTATLDAILADRRLQALRLRRIAPTVLVTPVDGATAVAMLRDKGFAPVVEGSDGSVVLPPREGHRAPPRPAPAAVPALSRLDEAGLRTLVARLREGEQARDTELAAQAALPGPRLPSTDPTLTVTLLREAAADRQRVWIGHIDGTGRPTRLLFLPSRVVGGRAFGTVEGSSEERAFSIHRITGAAPA